MDVVEDLWHEVIRAEEIGASSSRTKVNLKPLLQLQCESAAGLELVNQAVTKGRRIMCIVMQSSKLIKVGRPFFVLVSCWTKFRVKAGEVNA